MGYMPREWRELNNFLKIILEFSKWGMGGHNSSRRAHHLGERKEREAINVRKGSGDELRGDVGGKGDHTTKEEGPPPLLETQSII
jgi:hypothetical protein